MSYALLLVVVVLVGWLHQSWNLESSHGVTCPRKRESVDRGMSSMNDLLIEASAVVSSAFGTILARRMKQLSEQKKKRKKRRWWVRKWILERNSRATLVHKELRSSHTEDFKNLLRMSEGGFEYLLERVSPLISKSDTNMRPAITAKIKLTVTLRYLATGDSFKSLEFLFRVPKNTISKFIPETCEAIHKALQEFIKVSKLRYSLLDLFSYYCILIDN